MQKYELDKVFIGKVSEKNTERFQLHAMTNFAREGDSAVAESTSRFARNTKDLLELVEKSVPSRSSKKRAAP